MKLNHPELQSRLAAEYVLGTMQSGARRRFATYLTQSHSLRDEVAKWEAHLTPLAESMPALAPPARVWAAIQARTTDIQTLASTGISKRNASKTPANAGLLNSLNFWRNWGLGASALAAGLLVVASLGVMQPKEPMLTAVLESDGLARMVVEQPQANLITVKMVRPWKPTNDKSLQLWVLPKDGPPRSIGIINQNGTTNIKMAEMETMLAGGTAFALSKEPIGGSPTGQPTGMLLCKGVIAKMPEKKGRGQI